MWSGTSQTCDQGPLNIDYGPLNKWPETNQQIIRDLSNIDQGTLSDWPDTSLGEWLGISQ